MNYDENENRETVADIVAEMRNRADTVINGRTITERLFVPQEVVENWADRIETVWKRERNMLIREEVDDNYHPNDWRVYVIEDKVLVFFSGFENKKSTSDVPRFSATLDGAMKYDSFRYLASRERALSVRNRYVPNAKV